MLCGSVILTDCSLFLGTGKVLLAIQGPSFDHLSEGDCAWARAFADLAACGVATSRGSGPCTQRFLQQPPVRSRHRFVDCEKRKKQDVKEFSEGALERIWRECVKKHKKSANSPRPT